MIKFEDITACLVGRGNKPFDHIIDTLPYGEVIVWDNSARGTDLGVYGRYAAAFEAKNEWIYFQDDDVLFTEHEQLLDFFNRQVFGTKYTQFALGIGGFDLRHHIMVANDAHGPNRGGYDDLALSAAGAIVHKDMVGEAFSQYFRHYPFDRGVMYEADFIFGVLTPFIETQLAYTRLYADEDYHLCRQWWQEDLKLKYTNRARRIRDNR